MILFTLAFGDVWNRKDCGFVVTIAAADEAEAIRQANALYGLGYDAAIGCNPDLEKSGLLLSVAKVEA